MMAPMLPDDDRWLTLGYRMQGAEMLNGDLCFHSMNHDWRGCLNEIDTTTFTPPAVTKATAATCR